MGKLERMESAEAELAEWHKAAERIHDAIDSVPNAPGRPGHIANRVGAVVADIKALYRANGALTNDLATVRRESAERLKFIQRIAETLAEAGWGDADDLGQDVLVSLQALVASCERLADDACAANLGTPTIADHIKACVDAGYDVRRSEVLRG